MSENVNAFVHASSMVEKNGVLMDSGEKEEGEMVVEREGGLIF